MAWPDIWSVPGVCSKAVFHLSSCLIWTRWYGFRRLSLVKTVALWSGSTAELMRCKGYLFLTVMSFKLQKSIHGRREPSFLSTKKKLAPIGEEDGWMMLAVRDSLMYFSMAARHDTQREQWRGQRLCFPRTAFEEPEVGEQKRDSWHDRMGSN